MFNSKIVLFVYVDCLSSFNLLSQEIAKNELIFENKYYFKIPIIISSYCGNGQYFDLKQ